MQKEYKQAANTKVHVIPCSKSTATALKKSTMIHIARLVFLLLAALWISGYPKTIWQMGLIILFSLSALIEMYQIFYFQLSLHTRIVLSTDSATLNRFGAVTKTLCWNELAYVGRSNVKLLSTTRKAHPYIVLSKYKPEFVDGTSGAVRVHSKETILVEDTGDNWRLINNYCNNTEQLI